MKFAFLLLPFILSCGVRAFSASTEASYKTPDGVEVFYKSNKETEGVVVEIKEVDGKAKTITIKVESAGTSEAALAAAVQSNSKLADILEKWAPIIAKGALAGS